MKTLRIILLILIIIGLGLLLTQKFWVPKLVDKILSLENTPTITQVGTGVKKDNIGKIDTTNWKTYSDSLAGVSLKYPENFGTSYISVTDWPPKVQVLDSTFSCNPAGNEIERAGQTTEKIINGRSYCITKESEGAAGSIYTQYAYLTKVGNQLVSLTFSLRFVQCANYDDPKKTSCENERNIFDPDLTIDQIIQTINLL